MLVRLRSVMRLDSVGLAIRRRGRLRSLGRARSRQPLQRTPPHDGAEVLAHLCNTENHSQDEKRRERRPRPPCANAGIKTFRCTTHGSHFEANSSFLGGLLGTFADPRDAFV
jgi:hypothetical protein